MKKILYLMHIPWGWIQQRPHFFAEYLAQDYIVDVYYKKPTIVSANNLKNMEELNCLNLSIQGFRYLPFNKLPIIKHAKLEWVNKFLLSFQVPSFQSYDYVWFTSPSLYSMFNHLVLPHNKVIYDCMDDAIEFSEAKNNTVFRNVLLKTERELLAKADYVFCSSDYLKNKILLRSKIEREVVIINNAIELPLNENCHLPQSIIAKNEYLREISNPLMYVGAISEWFDFDLLLKVLDQCPSVNLVLVGPSDVKIPVHGRIHYLGTVERKYIFSLMSNSWALIMPFEVNELIRSVNPVKLYEYIYSMKPVIASRYSETMKFSKYINLYSSADELFEILNRFLKSNCVELAAQNERFLFVNNNTWSKRYNQIRKVLK